MDGGRRDSDARGGKDRHARQIGNSKDLAAAAPSNIAAIQVALAGTDGASADAASSQEILDMAPADDDRRLQNAIDDRTLEERAKLDNT
jgi:hypothetical protein